MTLFQGLEFSTGPLSEMEEICSCSSIVHSRCASCRCTALFLLAHAGLCAWKNSCPHKAAILRNGLHVLLLRRHSSCQGSIPLSERLKWLVWFLCTQQLLLLGVCTQGFAWQDIPDVEGDKVFGIMSFSVRMGQKKVFWMCVALLQSAYAAAVVFGLTSATLWSKVAMVLLKNPYYSLHLCWFPNKVEDTICILTF